MLKKELQNSLMITGKKSNFNFLQNSTIKLKHQGMNKFIGDVRKMSR